MKIKTHDNDGNDLSMVSDGNNITVTTRTKRDVTNGILSFCTQTDIPINSFLDMANLLNQEKGGTIDWKQGDDPATFVGIYPGKVSDLQQALAAERERAIEWQTFPGKVRVDLAAANERADDLRRRLADKEKAFSDVVIEADMIANDRRDELRRANERAERAEAELAGGAVRNAFDSIAKAVDPRFEYPGQVVRAVRALIDEIDEWKDATGLECGGDPGGVKPKHLRAEVERLRGRVDGLEICLEESENHQTEEYLLKIEAERDAANERAERAEADRTAILVERDLLSHEVERLRGQVECYRANTKLLGVKERQIERAVEVLEYPTEEWPESADAVLAILKDK